MNYGVDVQKYAEQDKKGKNNSGEQDQNLKQTWETWRCVQNEMNKKNPHQSYIWGKNT